LQNEDERKLAAFIMDRVAKECAAVDFSDVAPIVQEASGNQSFGLHRTVEDRLASVYYGLQSEEKRDQGLEASVTGEIQVNM
jgi:hypothetical protein